MTYNAKFENMLPMINITDQFIIGQDAYSTLEEDWLAYIQYTIKLAFNGKDTKFKTIRDAVKTRTSLLAMNDKAKNLLGMGNKFAVIDIDIDGNGQIVVKQLMSYNDLIKIFYGEKEKIHGVTTRAIIDKFFGFQWSRKKLLYPISNMPQGYQRPDNWNELVEDSEISQKLSVWFKQRIKSTDKQNFYHRRQALNRVLSSTRWYSPDQVTEGEITLLKKAIKKSSEKEEKRKRADDFDRLILNDLRQMLIEGGRDDIKLPRDHAREMRSEYFGDGSELERRFEWVDTVQHPNFAPLVKNAYSYIERLKTSGLSLGTINGKATAVNNFFRYVLKVFPFDEITVDTINEAFDPKSNKNLLKHLEEVRATKQSAMNELYKIIHYLVHAELYSSKARKNTPLKKLKTKLQPYRDAMPQEMVSHIIDILQNRPPQSTTLWNKEKADTTWWEHEVYPVYPMMMLFGYFIPVRGEQIRNLCRENSFVFNPQGQIDTFIINTDKNVNRKYLQEIPCAWDDLQIFVPFLKWHKEYFPYLQKVKYHNDDNSPWEDIVPLMITPYTLRPMSNSTHFDYHKRVLCQYQIEVIQKAKEEGHSNYPVVAWRIDGKPFFKDVEELNNEKAIVFQKNIRVSYDIHSLRVTGATRYLENGVGIKTVMDLTGHTSPDTLLRVYIRLRRDEKENTLRSASEKIFFGNKETLIESSNQLLRGELTEAYEREDISSSLEDNKLFSLYRKESTTQNNRILHQGTEIAKSKHPSTWRPMIHGICPAVKCPEGRENSCSLCPYLITGKLFTEGITHQLNNSFAHFQRESITIEEEKSKGYNNHAKIEGIETLFEEILGWQEILSKIAVDINEECTPRDTAKKSEMTLFKDQAQKIFGTESLSTELAYLKNAYDAQLMGVEKDRIGMKVLTIKAMKIAVKMGDEALFDSLERNESKSIDLLMQYYKKGVTHKEDVKKFITSVELLPKSD